MFVFFVHYMFYKMNFIMLKELSKIVLKSKSLLEFIELFYASY